MAWGHGVEHGAIQELRTMIALPQRAHGYTSMLRTVNALVEYCRAITPTESRSIAHEFLPSGVRSEVVIPPSVTTRSRSFDVTISGALKIQIAEGFVYLGRLAKTISGLTFDDDITVVPDASHKWSAWIEVDRSTAAAAFGSGTKPAAGTDQKEYWVLCDVTCNDEDTAIVELVQRWNSDIRITLFG